MRGKVLTALAVAVLFPMSLAIAPPAVGAINPSPAYVPSTRVELTPEQTLRYAITLTGSGTFSRLVLPLPAGASKVGVSIPASNIRSARLDSVRGGFHLRAATPYRIAAGTRLWVMINGIRTPPASTPAVTIIALSTSGTVLARGVTPAVTFTAPRACPSAWPRNHVTTENNLAGTTAWRLASTAYDQKVAAGFASHTSAKCGDTVAFRVTSNDYQLAVAIYRMGYYRGAGARLVWAAATAVRAFAQPATEMVQLDAQGQTINMPTGRKWRQTFAVRIDGTFRPGVYLVKITSPTSGKGSYVPLIVRDDAGAHDKLVLNSVATWQAYNTYGGASAYTLPVRSTRVSYDRPLVKNQGTGDFLSFEYGLVYWAEKQGYDLNYAADSDLHGRAYLADRAATLVLMPHTEYWSTAMRMTTDDAVAGGMNLASFGANQAYWRINPKPSTVTGADREFEIFRTGDTSLFRVAPDPNPEQSLLGAMFGCKLMDAAATPNDTWLWEGVSRSAVPHLAQGEVDYVHDGFHQPAGLDVLTTLTFPVCNRPGELRMDIVAVESGTGGRVFNASTHSWVCMLYGHCPWSGWVPTSAAQVQMGQATMNVFSWLDSGTAAALSGSDGSRLAAFRSQRIGTLRPLSGMPPLEPPVEG
jgi:hypothetical protein